MTDPVKFGYRGDPNMYEYANKNSQVPLSWPRRSLRARPTLLISPLLTSLGYLFSQKAGAQRGRKSPICLTESRSPRPTTFSRLDTQNSWAYTWVNKRYNTENIFAGTDALRSRFQTSRKSSSSTFSERPAWMFAWRLTTITGMRCICMVPERRLIASSWKVFIQLRNSA